MNEKNINHPQPASGTWTRRGLLKGAAMAATTLALSRSADAALPPSPRQAAEADLPPLPVNTVKPAVAFKAVPFDLAEVRLLPGLFQDAQKRDGAYLLSLEPDRLLHSYRANAGLPPKADAYGGWEKEGLAGHIAGHYLSACSLMYRATGDVRYRQRVDDMVSDLALCQQQAPDGLVTGIPDARTIFAKIAADGTVDGWVPWYNMHKLFAGLRDSYTYCGSETARTVFLKLNDWAIATTQGLTDAQFQKMLNTEHGGMAETTADAYAMTGDPKYLALAHRFTHHAVFDPLAAHQDRLDGLHSNTQIPKMIGYQRIARLTGEDDYHQAPLFFWETVTETRSFANGGNGDYEHFFPVADFHSHLQSDDETESCCSYNLLKLTGAQFQVNPSASFGDYYERTVLNHILATQEHGRGLMIYMTPMKQGHFKVYGDPENAMWCCTGTGMENHARYGEYIYSHTPNDSALYVNLYMASVLDWRAKGITVRQDTRYPEGETTRLTLTCARPTRLALKLRCPAWCAGMSVTVNGRSVPVDATPGTYVTLERTWRSGDVVGVHLPMTVRMEPLPNTPDKQAVFYGPTLLVGAMGTEGMDTLPDVSTNQIPYTHLPAVEASALVAVPAELTRRIQPVPGAAQPLTFRTDGLGQPSDVTLIPMYAMHHQRYNFYWSVYTPSDFAQQRAVTEAAAAQEATLDARTVDQFLPGNQQSEVDHHLDSQQSQTGDFDGKSWRDARGGGWFSFVMKVDPAQPMVLQCRYWGGDSGGRSFDVQVDGTTVGTTTLADNAPGQFWDVTYVIPRDLTTGKAVVTVKFQAHPGQFAGGLFDCRTLRAEVA